MLCAASVDPGLVEALRARLSAAGVKHPHAVDVLLRHALARALPHVPEGLCPVGVQPVVDGDFSKVEYTLEATPSSHVIVWPESVAELFER